MKDAGGVSTSRIVIALSDCWLTNLALACIPPGTQAGGMIITGAVMVCTLGDWRFSVVGLISGGLNVGVCHSSNCRYGPWCIIACLSTMGACCCD